MPMTLRQRNRLAAVRAVQATAVALFDERGYHAVTVEDIAREAGVSQSTFYRYFGTKEGIFTVDPFAAVGADSFTEIVDLDDPVAMMTKIAALGSDSAGPWPGMRYVMEEPVVRAAVYATMDSIADRVAAVLRERGEGPTQALTRARSLVFGVYFGALQQWYLDGRTRPVETYARDALAVLQPGRSGPTHGPP
jgi:AcrR family transcriptional regulator